MEIARTVVDLRKHIALWRKADARVGLVPTMGALLGSIPVALIYSFFVEHYVAGLTSGSVKA